MQGTISGCRAKRASPASKKGDRRALSDLTPSPISLQASRTRHPPPGEPSAQGFFGRKKQRSDLRLPRGLCHSFLRPAPCGFGLVSPSSRNGGDSFVPRALSRATGADPDADVPIPLFPPRVHSVDVSQGPCGGAALSHLASMMLNGVLCWWRTLTLAHTQTQACASIMMTTAASQDKLSKLSCPSPPLPPPPLGNVYFEPTYTGMEQWSPNIHSSSRKIG